MSEESKDAVESELMKASKNLQEKLDLIERIRGDLEKESISVPGIVVCGSQSAGKSSTLESICGFHFPTGEGMCTRCPAIVSLQVDPSQSEPVVLVSGEPDFQGVEACEIHEVSLRIEDITNNRCAGSKVSEDPIYIRITSKSGPVLTLTDIPGITAVSKDQVDIGEVTQRMTRDYINKDGMVVLVVIPGWEDFGNPVALKLAKEADPSGDRTIGVVTKVDCLPSNSDIVQKIKMERATDVELAQGFIAVRNRNKEEVAANVPDEIVREREVELFSTDPKLRELEANMWGIPTLVAKIVAIQMKVVASFFPELLSTLRSKIRALEELKKKLPVIISTDDEKHMKFVSIAQQINNQFSELKDGRSLSDDQTMNICARFHEHSLVFDETVRKGLPNFLDDEYKHFLHNHIKETRGVNLANFMSGPVFLRSIGEAFEAPVADGVAALLDNSFDLVAEVFIKIVKKAAAQYPLLEALLLDVVESVVDNGKAEAGASIDTLLKAENVVALTLHPDYMKSIEAYKSNLMSPTSDEANIASSSILGQAISSFLQTTKKKLLDTLDKTAADIFEMQVSLHCYAKVRKERIVDHIVLFVRYFLFTRMSETVSKAIWNIQSYKECLNPDPEVLRQSVSINRKLDRLQRIQTEVKKTL
jgi:dynamin 1-like protein